MLIANAMSHADVDGNKMQRYKKNKNVKKITVPIGT